jgi:hypothetical protein
MRRAPSKTLAWLKKGISIVGILTFLAGVTWAWTLRNVWPRAAGDPVPLPLLEAVGAIVGGLALVSKVR